MIALLPRKLKTELKVIFNSIPTQDVNELYYSSLDKKLPHTIDPYMPLLGKRKWYQAKQICGHYLVGNIQPHEDSGYCNSEGYKTAFIWVWDIESRKTKQYPDSNTEVNFYSDKKWTVLKKGSVLKFDPRKEHALMTDNPIKVIVFWF